MYTRDEALAKALEYFENDSLAANVFLDKYALKTATGELLEATPDEMHRRMAAEFARIEAKYPNPLSEDEIYEAFKNFSKIVPQGSPMEGIGNNNTTTSLSNCFVIDSPSDSYGGIMNADQQEAQLMKRRGGVGMDISKIRPKGMPTNNAAKTTDGIAVFMDRFSNTCREVAQNGRRGALMLTIDVRHPEVETFINIKRDKTRVTGANISVKMTDEFMSAVKNDTTYTQQWPVDSDNPTVKKEVKARDVWNQIVDAAWTSAEPGVLFWDNALKNTPADIYTDEGFGSVSTNPCLVGDTYVYVADGRGLVKIKDLADQAKDVNVFCYDNNNNITVKKMRNPRITGYNQKIFKITFDDGTSVRATNNHKFMLLNGEYKELKDLKQFDQLKTVTRYENSLQRTIANNKKTKQYYWIKDSTSNKMEHRYIAEAKYGKIDGFVIHHADFDSKNNAPENLIKMTKEDHDRLHGDMMKGDNNPMRRAQSEWSKEKWETYSKNMSDSTSGDLNGNAKKNVTNEDIKNGAINLVKTLGRRFSSEEWLKYADKNGLPKTLTAYRRTDEYKNVSELAFVACNEVGLEDQAHDTRLLQTRLNAIADGYEPWIENHKCWVTRACEQCGSTFKVEYAAREHAFCSPKCIAIHVANKEGVNEKRIQSLRNTYGKQTGERKKKILDEYTLLKAKLGRDPKEQELIDVCNEKKIPYRLRTKTGFGSYAEIKEHAKTHNHRIISIEEDGFENVYNGTVDEYHNFFFSGDPGIEKSTYSLFIGKNCGEIVLSQADSCRLISLNLLSFVVGRFTEGAYFDFGEFRKYVKMAQRLMDDMIDLELEKLDAIIEKVRLDPEREEVKRIELELWEKIRETCARGRRTGLGITALGDALAAIGVIYGSDESIAITEKIYKTLGTGAHESSIDLAEERGAFSVFDYEKERGHEYMSRMIGSIGEEYLEKWKKYGRRNIALTTTAPTGTVSLMTQTTSGIEPCFRPVYKRRKKIQNSGDRVDHVDINGDKWTEFEVCHHRFSEWRRISGKTAVEDSPYYKATANDIDWLASVEIQAAAQRWVDHSISKTGNLPSDVSKELVSEIYLKAWESGCKGFTIYRDGCRDGVLITDSSNKKKEEEKTFSEHDAPKRPKLVECDVKQVKIKGESWTVFVGLVEGRPFEIFCGKSSLVNIPKDVVKGNIHKTGKSDRGVYDFIGGDSKNPVVIKDIVKTFDNANHATFTRFLSLSLRHGAAIQYVVEQLQKDDGDLNSFEKVLSRVLKSYIKEGAVRKQKCPNCGAEGTLVYQEGCLTCTNCSHSKCG